MLQAFPAYSMWSVSFPVDDICWWKHMVCLYSSDIHNEA